MLSLKELQNLTAKELLGELAKAQKVYNQTRIHISTNHSKNTHTMKKHKRYIAQIYTVLRENQLIEETKSDKNSQE